MIATVYRINEDVTIEATSFESEKPVKWAVRFRGSVMSKNTGKFVYEPFPTERTYEFLNEHRFDSAEEAEKAFYKYYNNEKTT